MKVILAYKDFKNKIIRNIILDCVFVWFFF